MTGFPQNESNMFSMLRSNYTCISDEQAAQLAKMITTNNKILNSGSAYSGTSFDLYNYDSFVQTSKSANGTQPKKKQSDLDSIIDEDSFPVKMPKTIFDKFADWLSGFEIPDDVETLTLEDMGLEQKEMPFSLNINMDYGVFQENMVQDRVVESQDGLYS